MSWPRRRRVLGSGVLLLLGATLCLAAWILAEDPRGWVLAAPPPATIAIYDRNGSLLYEALDPLHGKASPVSLRDLPPHLLHATIATEDASFYSNPGLDPVAILRALVQNWRSGDQVSGGSTLTQQLARNPWMRPGERSEPSLLRKIREALLAIRGAARLGKDEILELYLNMAPYGHQAIGVDAAARVYFGKGARDLDLAEAALLAGLPQAPSAYDPLLEPSRAKARQQIVLSLKPLLYATAMERGVTPATVLYDVPTSFLTADGKSYSPENYDRVWHGPVSAREALANSYNLPAVKLLQQVGIGAFLEVATRAGISTLASKRQTISAWHWGAARCACWTWWPPMPVWPPAEWAGIPWRFCGWRTIGDEYCRGRISPSRAASSRRRWPTW